MRLSGPVWKPPQCPVAFSKQENSNVIICTYICCDDAAEPIGKLEEHQQEQQPAAEELQQESGQEVEELGSPQAEVPKLPAKPAREEPRLQRRARKRNAAVAAAIEAEEWRSEAEEEENSEEEAGEPLTHIILSVLPSFGPWLHCLGPAMKTTT